MDPFTLASLASMAAGTLSQIGTGQENAEAQRRAREGQIADQLAASAARRGYRTAERGRQAGYAAEQAGEAKTAVDRFSPAAWQATEGAAFDKMAPAWEANADSVDAAIGGQAGAPALIAKNLAAKLDQARQFGRANARSRAKLAAGNDLSLATKGDAARTASRVAAINDYSGASQSLLPTEQAIVPEIVRGDAPVSKNSAGDLLVGAGQLGLGFGDKLAPLLGIAPKRPGAYGLSGGGV